jgi:excisionase family DNA binding protein
MPDQYCLKTKRETARYLGVSLGSLERLMRSGLPYIRVSNMVRFRPEDLTHFIERRRVECSPNAACAAHAGGEVRSFTTT